MSKQSCFVLTKRRMECSAFVRGFIPGIMIGLFSSILLFNTLWRESDLRTERISEWFSHKLPLATSLDNVQPPAPSLDREVRKHRAIESMCDPSEYLKTQPVKTDKHLLVVMVHSTPRSADLRDAIRASWLSKQNADSRYLARFVIGARDLKPKDIRDLSCENKQYGDLVLLPDVTDTLKMQEWSSSHKLLSSFKWAKENLNFSYILKCSDTTFAILKPILTELELRNQTSKTGDYLWGFFAGGVQAAKEGRLGEKNWFLCSHYLPFPQGGGYVISHSLVSLLLSLEGELQHYAHDDIALGVWISPFNGIEKQHDVRFNSGYYSRGCKNVYILTHKETLSSMMQKYVNLMQNGCICKKEFISRLSYVYNWTAPANRCCVRTPDVP